MTLDERQTLLAAHIDRVKERPCEWGVDDCTRWAADWVEAVRGVDLMLPTYRGEAEGRALIAGAGGLEKLWSDALAFAGIYRVCRPSYGDVGLIETRMGPVGAIAAHDGLCAVRTLSGVSFLRPRDFRALWAI